MQLRKKLFKFLLLIFFTTLIIPFFFFEKKRSIPILQQIKK